MEELFDRLRKAKFFLKMDLRSRYYQVCIASGDEVKTTCVTNYGSFEFLVMPFGLTNAPATFYNPMNNVFSEYINSFVVLYLDGIVVYNEFLEEYIIHLRKALEKLRSHKLFLKP